MSYQKNQWREKAGLKRVNNGFELPLTGAMIDGDSDLRTLKFKNRLHEQVKIYGEYVIQVEETKLNSLELEAEVFDYFSELIRNCRVDVVLLTKDHDLIIKIDSDPVVVITVPSDPNQLPVENWEYAHRSGYIS